MAGYLASDPFRAPFVHAVGGELQVQVEDHPNPNYVDHVWITMNAGSVRPLVSINTLSKRNREAGFDPRIRLGTIQGTWETLPRRGIEAAGPFDYEDLEREHAMVFESHERRELEEILVETTKRANLLEVWGAPYRNKNRFGIHQIHSRRASCAVPADTPGHDGALRFYFSRDKTTSLFLFKFCGQP